MWLCDIGHLFDIRTVARATIDMPKTIMIAAQNVNQLFKVVELFRYVLTK